jgi:peptidoglycan/LPS O-acetylase OafA/YrhL
VVPVMILATLSNPGGIMGRVLEFKTLRLVGLISYSLYLWQGYSCRWSRLTA